MEKLNESERKLFLKEDAEASLTRIASISRWLLLIVGGLCVLDLLLINSKLDPEFRLGLIYIHIGCFILLGLYAVNPLWLKRSKPYSYQVYEFLVMVYFAGIMGLGVWNTINSTLNSLNLMMYSAAMFLLLGFTPLRPLPTFAASVLSHMTLVAILPKFTTDTKVLFSALSSSTITLLIGLSISISYYQHRKKEFRMKQTLVENDLNLEKLFQVNPFPLLIISLVERKVRKINDKAIHYYKLDGIHPGEIKPEDYILDVREFDAVIEELKIKRKIQEYVIELKNEYRRNWIMCNFELIDYHGEPCALLGIFDITKIKLLEYDLTEKASIDSLTGVLNRMKGIELLKESYNRAVASKCRLSVVFCDINELKMINDHFGHNEGDFLIAKIVDEIVIAFGKTDTVFRYGGDEFVLFSEEKSVRECTELMEKVNDELKKKKRELHLEYNMSISYGVSEFTTETSKELEEVLDEADERMYRYKANFRKANGLEEEDEME